MGYLNYNLEKIASVVRAAAKLAGTSAGKMSDMQRLKPIAPRANLVSKLGSKARSWLKSKIKPQSKSIDLSGSDASWLNNAGLRAQLSAAPKFKIPL